MRGSLSIRAIGTEHAHKGRQQKVDVAVNVEAYVRATSIQIMANAQHEVLQNNIQTHWRETRKQFHHDITTDTESGVRPTEARPETNNVCMLVCTQVLSCSMLFRLVACTFTSVNAFSHLHDYVHDAHVQFHGHVYLQAISRARSLALPPRVYVYLRVHCRSHVHRHLHCHLHPHASNSIACPSGSHCSSRALYLGPHWMSNALPVVPR